jgi:very-short-patch-repair endonuclease
MTFEKGYHPNTEFKKSCVPWNKGKHIKFNNALEEYRKNGGKPSMLGKHHSEETKIKISKAKSGKKGHVAWDKGTKGLIKHSEKSRKAISEALKGNQNWRFRKYSPKGRKNPEHSIIMKKLWQNENYRKKCLSNLFLKNNEMSSLEKKMLGIVQKFNLPYRFVGNGQFFIENKCPDFINCNGEKIAMEVFYKGHKEYFRQGLQEWKDLRQEIFAKYGWKILFFDETQINEKNVLERIK